MPSSKHEPRKLEDPEIYIICSNIINLKSFIFRLGQRINGGRCIPSKAGRQQFYWLCVLQRAGPHPSGPSTSYNLIPFNYSLFLSTQNACNIKQLRTSPAYVPPGGKQETCFNPSEWSHAHLGAPEYLPDPFLTISPKISPNLLKFPKISQILGTSEFSGKCTRSRPHRLFRSSLHGSSPASRDRHDPVLTVATLLPMIPSRYTRLTFQSSESVTPGHGRSSKYISHHFSFPRSEGHLHARTAAGLTPVCSPVL